MCVGLVDFNLIWNVVESSLPHWIRKQDLSIYSFITLLDLFSEGGCLMVNREQEVIDRVQNERVVHTEPLREMFNIEPFEESLMRNTENVFDIDAVGHQTQATESGSLVAPAGEQES